VGVEVLGHLLHVLDAARCLRHFPVLEIDGEGESAEVLAFREIAERIRADTGINVAALSGGCWQNGLLRERFAAMLTECGFDVLMNNRVPLNDGGLSLGQAWVAAHVARSFSREKMECALQSP
jgi:tRNA A37 threonylcarbamoyltransferase TsaD